MVIWTSFDEYALSNIISCVLVLAALTGIILLSIKVVVPFIQMLRQGEGSKKACYLGLSIFSTLIIILSAVCGFWGHDLYQSASFEYNCSKGNYEIVRGDVQLVSSTPEYYRGQLVGYNVVLKMDDTIISPSDAFQNHMVMLFDSDEELEIKYRKSDNDKAYTWEISMIL